MNRVPILRNTNVTIKTAEGLDVCKIQPSWRSARCKRKFSDMQGNELFTMRIRRSKLLLSYVRESPSGHSFPVKGKLSGWHWRSVCTFVNASDGKAMELSTRADPCYKNAEIWLGDGPVASVSRSSAWGQYSQGFS